MKEAFGCLEANSNAQDSIRILKRLLHGGYSDALKSIRMGMDAIWILEESIRMPVIQNHEQQRTNTKKTRNKCFKT